MVNNFEDPELYIRIRIRTGSTKFKKIRKKYSTTVLIQRFVHVSLFLYNILKCFFQIIICFKKIFKFFFFKVTVGKGKDNWGTFLDPDSTQSTIQYCTVNSHCENCLTAVWATTQILISINLLANYAYHLIIICTYPMKIEKKHAQQ